jgi:Txe/YoeB family toxin of Txe-Axe toxin-antitoxin module
MINKIKEVNFLDNELRQSYLDLNKSGSLQPKLYHFITRAIDDLRRDSFSGRMVVKDLISKKIKNKYKLDFDNLWVYNLPNAWRLIYTITGTELKIVSIILDWLSHKDYERLFGF